MKTQINTDQHRSAYRNKYKELLKGIGKDFTPELAALSVQVYGVNGIVFTLGERRAVIQNDGAESIS